MMLRTFLLLASALLSACGGPQDTASAPAVEARMAAPAPMAMDKSAPGPVSQGGVADEATPRYMAERQFWVFELPEKAIEARWQAHIDLCKVDCEVLGAALNKSAQMPVSASLQLRVGRASADKLFGAMHSNDVSERRVEREDKTLQVVDVEARLKNLGELRDRLRALLANRGGALKDILETERELARVQGELDAMAAQRKALANETEKILLYADYRPEPSIGETGAMQPLFEAWRGAGRAFAESLGAALLFVVQALPWLVIVVPIFWGAWKGLKRIAAWWRGRRSGKAAP
jgi:hypothetical protein